MRVPGMVSDIFFGIFGIKTTALMKTLKKNNLCKNEEQTFSDFFRNWCAHCAIPAPGPAMYYYVPDRKKKYLDTEYSTKRINAIVQLMCTRSSFNLL
jgi:hypothetical protein